MKIIFISEPSSSKVSQYVANPQTKNVQEKKEGKNDNRDIHYLGMESALKHSTVNFPSLEYNQVNQTSKAE